MYIKVDSSKQMSTLHTRMQRVLINRLDKQGSSSGEICPPPCHALSNYDRVPPRMFWHMVMLLQEIYNHILDKNPHLTRVSDDTLLEQLQGYATGSNVRDNAIFQALFDAL